MDTTSIINRYYPAGTLRRDIYLRHCTAVADLAVDIAKRLHLPLDLDEVRAAAMLHDIGICMTSAPDIGCTGSEPYIAHGILGARLLRENGADEKYARVAERHTGAGITADEVIAQNLPIPPADYMPETLLEKLVCYADKFYSKSGDMKRKDLDRVRRSMASISGETLRRFDALHALFS